MWVYLEIYKARGGGTEGEWGVGREDVLVF